MTKVDGKISHPFTDITFSQNGNLVVKVKTDRFGFYKTEFNNANLEQDQDISVLYTKADLKTVDIIEFGSTSKINVKETGVSNKIFNNLISTVFSHLNKEALAQSSIKITSSNEAFKLSPIFPYIEGYAYDQNNKVLPNAVIRLRLKMNKASIYEIKADNNGYFKVLPKHVPIFPYYLEILPQSGGAITYTTSEFAKKNKEYLDNNKINLANTTREDKSLITGKLVQTASKTVSTNNKENAETVEKKSKSSTTLFLVFIIFIFLVLIGLTVFFIIKNKNNSPLPPQNF